MFDTPSAPTDTTQSTTPTQGPETGETTQKPDQGSEWSKRFAELAKREKSILEKNGETKSLKQKLAELESEVNKYKSYKEKIKVGDYGDIMDDLGIAFDDLSQYYVNGAKPTKDPEIMSLKEKIEAMERQKEEEEEKKIDAQKQEKFTEYKNYLANYAKDGNYEYINSDPSETIPVVFELMRNFHEEHGRILSEKEACDLVEDHLEKKYEKLLSLKKFEEKFKAKTAQTAPNQSNNPDRKPDSPFKTLTSDLSPRTQTEGSKILDPEESLRQAASLIKWI